MAPIVKTFPSYNYIKDSQHALEIFRDFSFLGQNKVILTMDITSLYTVIPNGLQAVKHFFDHRTVKEPSSETLLRLVELALTLNCFSFGGQGRPGGVVEYQYTRKKIDKIPQNTPNSSKYTQK